MSKATSEGEAGDGKVSTERPSVEDPSLSRSRSFASPARTHARTNETKRFPGSGRTHSYSLPQTSDVYGHIIYIYIYIFIFYNKGIKYVYANSPIYLYI